MHENVKNLVIYCEEISDESFPQILLELRDALDHIIRVISIETGLLDANVEYVQTNLESAFNHLYRAGYDALDYSGLVLREFIENELNGFSPDVISEVLPEYYRTYRPRINKINEQIGVLRGQKDVGNASLERFNDYLKLNNELKSYYEEIISLKPSLIDLQKQKKRDIIMYPAIVGVISALIGVVLTKLFC